MQNFKTLGNNRRKTFNVVMCFYKTRDRINERKKDIISWMVLKKNFLISFVKDSNKRMTSHRLCQIFTKELSDKRLIQSVQRTLKTQQ